MGQVVYKSESKIERVEGPFRKAYIPATEAPVDFGVHGAIAEHYGVTGKDEVATTLDYIVAATGGWLAGTFGGALEARGISASSNCLETKVVGEVEKEGNVLVLKRIHVKYRLKGSVDSEEVANRVHALHRDSCPVYKSISDCIEITTELKFVTG